MRKILLFIKSYWILILIVFTLFIYLANLFIKKPSVPVTPTANKIAKFGEILPGKTSVEKVDEILGKPIGSETQNGNTILDYKTTNKYINDQVVANNDLVKIVKKAVIFGDKTNAETITKDFGIAPYTLYKQSSNSVFNLYVYPQNGIAYLGHLDGTVMEIWYFEPTTIEDFISKWAPNYSQSKFQGQSQY